MLIGNAPSPPNIDTVRRIKRALRGVHKRQFRSSFGEAPR